MMFLITLCNYVNQFSLNSCYNFSRRRPPAVSDHFVLRQGWSLRDLTAGIVIIVSLWWIAQRGRNSRFAVFPHISWSSSKMSSNVTSRCFLGLTGKTTSNANDSKRQDATVQYHVLFIVCHTIFIIVTNFSSSEKEQKTQKGSIQHDGWKSSPWRIY